MAYELRIPGRPPRRCATQEEAERLARDALRTAADAEPEVIDLSTGRPAQPAGSPARRNDLANKIGY